MKRVFARSRHSAEQGFTIVEVMVASVITIFMILAVATFQANMVQENRALGQKSEVAEFGKVMGQIFADDELCRCNTQGLALVQDPASAVPGASITSHADLIGPLKSHCSPDKILAEAGADLPGAAQKLPIARIFVGDLIKIGPSARANTDIYSGAIQVLFGDDPSQSTRKLVRALQPAKVQKKFFVSSGRIVSCGASENEITFALGNELSPAPDYAGPPSIAECPAGTQAIGGGWRVVDNVIPTGCPSPAYAAAIYSEPDSHTLRHWRVLVLCQHYQAYATCYRPSFPRSP